MIYAQAVIYGNRRHLVDFVKDPNSTENSRIFAFQLTKYPTRASEDDF
jgi:hypothetical protein